jgi:hypothetical protein
LGGIHEGEDGGAVVLAKLTTEGGDVLEGEH